MARPATTLTELPPPPGPHPSRPGHIGVIVAASLVIGPVAALVLVVVVFAGAREHVITGTALLGFALGWGLLALWSERRANQHQRWALVPATFLGLSGMALLLLAPSDRVQTLLGWVWPPALLALAVWMGMQARRSLVSWTRAWLIYPVCAITALVGVVGAVETVHEVSALNASAAGQTYDVGGHRLYLECSGAGSPTVVLASGFGSHTPSWAWIAPAVARDTRVCTYDRAGEGRSGPATGPQNGIQLAADLHTLLAKANVTGPYVLVGHSVGGTYNLVFAARYPTEVAGMVLLDSTSPHQFALIPSYPGVYETFRRAIALFPSLARLGLARPAFGSGFTELPAAARDQERAFAVSTGELRGERDEWSQFPAVFRQAQAMTDFGTKPLLVLTADKGQDPGWPAAQDQLAALSHNTAHRTVGGATHEALLINRSFATISADGVREVVHAVRAGTPMRP